DARPVRLAVARVGTDSLPPAGGLRRTAHVLQSRPARALRRPGGARRVRGPDPRAVRCAPGRIWEARADRAPGAKARLLGPRSPELASAGSRSSSALTTGGGELWRPGAQKPGLCARRS